MLSRETAQNLFTNIKLVIKLEFYVRLTEIFKKEVRLKVHVIIKENMKRYLSYNQRLLKQNKVCTYFYELHKYLC